MRIGSRNIIFSEKGNGHVEEQNKNNNNNNWMGENKTGIEISKILTSGA